MKNQDTASFESEICAEKRAGFILILANPTSGGFNAKTLQKVKANLEVAGKQVELRLTDYAGQIGETCSDPALDAEAIIIAGGDGSVNEALGGFQNRINPPILGVIPFGTANVLALELKLPKRPRAIAKMILKGKTEPLHFGSANGRPFVLMASTGFDAEVVHAVPLDLKRRMGKLAYVITALKTGFSQRPAMLDIVLDGGRKLKGKFAVASNARHYGGPFAICPSSVTEPGLHMLVLKHSDPLSVIGYGLALLAGQIHNAHGADVVPFTTAEISGTTPVAAQVDGDPFGATPLEISQPPQTVPIFVPK